MTKTIFIASAEPYSGKSIVALGLVNMLLGKAQKIGYFKPIINHDPNVKKDVHIQTIIEHFGLPISIEDTYAFTRQQAMRHLESENQGEMIDTIISKFKKLEENYDFTILEGSDFVGEGAAFEFESNARIAKNLNAPVILVVSGEKKSTAQIINDVLTLLRNFETREIQVLAIVANKIHQDQLDDVWQLLKNQLPADAILAVIPEDKGLQNPTVNDIYQNLGGKLLFGEEYLSNRVDNFVTGAMHVPNFL
ncbi:MAG: phosphotransacetylase family protein, partial [Sphingobacteriaceae bacterium]